jgi:hypothetical protein
MSANHERRLNALLQDALPGMRPSRAVAAGAKGMRGPFTATRD